MFENGFRPHSEKQERALNSVKPILLLGVGTQWGKSTIGAIRMAKAMHQYTHKDDAFIITAPTYKILMQSTIRPFLSLMEGRGRYDKKDDCFRMMGGGTCYARTETDPDSIVGITNVRRIWADECGKYRKYFWENIQARADFCGAPVDLTTSPYNLNWVFKELIKPVLAGGRPDVDYIRAASWENPYHSLHDYAKREAKRGTMDERRFRMIYGGEFERPEGLVYDCWDDDLNLVTPFDFPTGTKYYGGIDWGFHPDPFVVKIRAITPDGYHYGVSEFVKTRQTITDIINVLRQKSTIFGVQAYYCDPSQPGLIEELNRHGLAAIGADNDLRRGIDLHYELIKTTKYREFRGACPHSCDEREAYHYPEPEDLKPDEDSKNLDPVDAVNHCMDADRYLTISTVLTGDIRTPKEPGRKKYRTRLEELQNSYKRRIIENVRDM